MIEVRTFRQILLVLSLYAIIACSYTTEGKALSAIIVGGSSGMGKACAKAIVSRGGKVLIVSRSPEKLERAAAEIRECIIDSPHNDGDLVQTRILDASKEGDVEDFSRTLEEGEYDSLVVSCAGRAPHGPITGLETDLVKDLFDTKFWSAYFLSKYISPKLKENGSIAFVGGILNRRPGINCVPLAGTNGALEGLTRALALEFGPRLRVNCLSPGFCDTERFNHMDEAKKKAMLKNTAESLPLQRVGQPEDMGEALFYLLTAPFVTGVVLDCDGGHGIRQYASVSSDPMRSRST